MRKKGWVPCIDVQSRHVTCRFVTVYNLFPAGTNLTKEKKTQSTHRLACQQGMQSLVSEKQPYLLQGNPDLHSHKGGLASRFLHTQLPTRLEHPKVFDQVAGHISPKTIAKLLGSAPDVYSHIDRSPNPQLK